VTHLLKLTEHFARMSDIKKEANLFFFFNFRCCVSIFAPVPCPEELHFILYTEICRVFRCFIVQYYTSYFFPLRSPVTIVMLFRNVNYNTHLRSSYINY